MFRNFDIKLVSLGLFFSLGAVFWGYDIGIISTVLVSAGFLTALDHPSASQTGTITAIYYAGTFTGYWLFAGYANDRLGRRWASFVGIVVLCIGAALQAGSVHLAMMIVGRIVAGWGTTLVATAVPLYLAEIAPSKQRGAFVTMNQVGIVSGIAVAFWLGYGYSFWTTPRGVDLQWRLSIIMQFIPAIVFCAGAPFIPESPRWLMEHDRTDEAAKVLTKLRRSYTSQEVQRELDEIQANIQWHKVHSVHNWKVFFTNKALFARLWRAWILQFLQQMSGATGIRYYLPTNFLAAGTSKELSLLASGLDSTVQVLCTIAGIFLIDRIGRRHALGIGAAIMAFSLMINGALQTAYPNQVNGSANVCNIFFIFFFTLGYSMGFGPNAWTYGAEIFPANVRAKGLAISASGSSIGAIIVGQVWPVAVARIGARTYFIFMTFNIIAIILVYTVYPETKGKTLEELDSHFGHINVHAEDEATPEMMFDKQGVEHIDVTAVRAEASKA